MRGFRALMLMVTLVTPITARAEINTVSKVAAHAEGAKTIVVVHGSATPSFTAYRLERPPRVVVDLADGKLTSIEGPTDVDTWAVGQIATAQYSDEASRTARVMIGFKRPSSYDVRAKGHDVIITITPDERPPADQLAAASQKSRADAELAQKSKAEAELAQRQAAEERKKAVDERRQASDERKQANDERKQANDERKQASDERLRSVEAARAAELEQRQAATERQRATDAERQAAEVHKQASEEQKRAADERRQAAEEQKRAADERRQAAEEQKRVADERKQAAEEQKRVADERKQAAEEQKRLADERRQAAEDQKRVADDRKLAAEDRKLAAEEQKRAGDERKQAAEQQRRAAVELQRATEEQKRAADERKLAAEEQKRAAEEQKRAAEGRKQTVEAERRAAELQKQMVELQKQTAELREQAKKQVGDAEARRLLVDEQLKAAEAERSQAQKQAAQLQAETQKMQAARAEADRALKAAEAAQKQAERARLDEEQRLQAVREARAEEERRAKKQADGIKAGEEANRRAEAARHEAEAAKTRAQAAQEELRRVIEQKQKEEARLLAAGEQQKIEQAKVTALRLEAEQLAEKRAEEAKKLAQIKAEEAQRLQAAQAEARKIAEQKTARAEEAQAQAARRAELSEAARKAEERKARAQAEEAARLNAAAQAQKKLDAAESAIAETERRAKKAAESAEAERRRLESMRAESLKLGEAARQAREEVSQQRAESARLFAVQEAERARVEAARLDARKLADQRTQEAARAAHAAALASASKGKMEAAELDARRIAAEAAQESSRLEAVRKESLALAERRQAELKKLEAARLDAQSLTAKREAELKTLDGERAQKEQDLVSARHQFVRLSADVKALEHEKLTNQAALQESARRRGELESEREQLEQKIAHAQSQLAQTEQRALEQKKAVESQRLKAESEKSRVESERSQIEKDKSRIEGERSRLEGERADLEQKVTHARDELKRLEAAARSRLAVVPTPARVAAKESKAPPKAQASVRDVRFADSDEAERVIVEIGGDPDCSVLKSDGRTAVLRIAGATLPKKLERTLDAAAYEGPVRTVSTYRDPDDAGAVRVVVALAEGAASETKLVRDDGRLSWEFPRAQKLESRSYSPEKVGGFGASIPLQTAQAAQSLPAAGQSRSLRRHTYTGKRIDLDFKDADIHNILRLLSDVGQVNIVTSDDVKGTVTIRMRDVPWDQALDVILKAKGLGMQREGNLIRVAPAAVLEKEIEAEVARAKAAVELKPIETRLVPLSYADGTHLLPRVQDVLSPRGKVSVDTRTNMLIVSDVAGNIALAEDLVRNLDTQTPQVLIEARIVEATTNFLRDIGIQWGGNGIASQATGNPTGIVFPSTVGVGGGAVDAITTGINTSGLLNGQAASPNYVVNLPAAVGTGSGGALGLTLGSVSGNVNINLRLSALENTGNVRIVSAPKITTLDNMEASIEQGVAIPISVVSAAGTNTLFVDAKLNLTVKPHVTNEGSVVMNIAITRNEPDFVNTGARGDPTILKKQAKTEMLVRDGDTAVIGGIYTRNTGLSYTKVPWFADIPILGWLFKNRRENDDRTELLIFITPRIVNRASTSAARR